MTGGSNITPIAPTTISPRLEKFFQRVTPARGRIIFGLDATASRQPTWDLAARLQNEMFASVAAIGSLDVQLLYFRGVGECVASQWLTDARSLAGVMSTIMCRAGPTQIAKILAHACNEHQREKVNALIIVSDACEEVPSRLYDAARALGTVPTFMFQEGNNESISTIYGEIARITGGALASFNAGAATRLADLLKAVAAFATGGLQALAAQKSEAATLLLTQMER
jgi:hypothetical protein